MGSLRWLNQSFDGSSLSPQRSLSSQSMHIHIMYIMYDITRTCDIDKYSARRLFESEAALNNNVRSESV